MKHTDHHKKGPVKLLNSLFKRFYLFLIILWYEKNTELNMIDSKYNNCDKTTSQKLYN